MLLAGKPLTCDMHNGLAASPGAHPELDRLEMIAQAGGYRLRGNLGREAPEGFSDRHGPQVACRFWQRDEGGSAQPWLNVSRRCSL